MLEDYKQGGLRASDVDAAFDSLKERWIHRMQYIYKDHRPLHRRQALTASPSRRLEVRITTICANVCGL